MASTFTYQQASCVLLTPLYVPGVVTHADIVNATGGKHTQAVDTPELELAVYGTLQLVNAKQAPPNQGNISVVETSGGSLSRLEKAAYAAFRFAAKEQNAAALGINFVATTVPSQDAKTLVLGLLNPRIVKQGTNTQEGLKSGGIKMIYGHKPWTATLSIEADQSNEKQILCSVNLNLNTPNKSDLSLVKQVTKQRGWFEQIVNEIVGKGTDA